MPIGKSWAGQVYGTHIGKVSADLTSAGDDVSGTIRINLDQDGLIVLNAVGRYVGAELTLTLTPNQLPPETDTFTGTLQGVLQPDGNITGTWNASSGAGGPFVLHPHPGATRLDAPSGPRQLHSSSQDLGWIRLGKTAVLELLRLVEKEFPLGTAVVTVESHGVERSFYGSDFEVKAADIKVSRLLRISVQQPEAPGINRSLSIDLGPSGNSVRAVSIDEAWAVGLAQTASAKLKRSILRSATLLQRTGLLFLLYLFILLLGAPELPIQERAAFIALTLSALAATAAAFQRFIPRTEVYPGRDQVSSLQRTRAIIGTILLAAAGGLVSGLTLAGLKGELNWLVESPPPSANEGGSIRK